jgi:phage terminase large subunit-like protein
MKSNTISNAYLAAHNPDALASLTPAERVVLLNDAEFWTRHGQMPLDDDWTYYGWIAGRGAGKSFNAAGLVQQLVDTGRARKIALCAQDEVRTHEVCVATLKENAPPWSKPELRLGSLHWPNGAEAYIYTPESPEAMRGPTFDLVWATELSFWHHSVAVKAFDNVTTACRPEGRVIWDSTSKGSSPLIQYMMRLHKRDPDAYRVIRGSMLDNPMYSRKYVQRESFKYGGPGARRYEEEVNGAVFDSEEGAAFAVSEIDKTRVEVAPALELKVIGLDSAITTHRAADETGIVFGGRDARGHVYALRDRSGRHEPEQTGQIVIDAHYDGYAGAVVETNRGGNLIVAVLKAVAKERDVEVRVIKSTDKFPRYTKGVFYVREVTSRGKKIERAEPVATLMKIGKCHLVGKLPELETQLTTYDGSGESPNSFDGFVMAMSELGNLFVDTPLVSHRQKRSEQEAEANRQLVTALSAKARAKSVL